MWSLSFIAACRIFSCGLWNLVPWPRIKPGPPALELQSLSHGPPGKSQFLLFNMHCCCCCLVASVMSDSCHAIAGLLCPWDSLGKSTRVGCQALLQGIFPTQGWNPVPCIVGRFFTTEPPGEPLRCVWWGLISTLLIPHYYGKTFLSTLPSASWIRRYSSLPAGHRHYSQPCVSSGHYTPLILLGGSFSGLK